MKRLVTLATGLVLAIFSGGDSAGAQVILGPQGPVNPEKQQQERAKTESGGRLYQLTVDPAPEPAPALKYSLLPGPLDQKPGDGVPFYYRALLMYREIDPVHRKAIDQWSDLPADKLPEESVRQSLDRFQHVLETLREAAYREECDWQWRLENLDGANLISFLLPELSDARSLARLLSLKAHVEIADGQYREAIQTLTIGYKLARDVARPRTLVNGLVGIAIASLMNERLLELIDAPGSPNLYWAIAELPRPLIDLRPAMQQEMLLPLKMFPFLRDAKTAHRTPEDWRDLVLQAMRDVTKLSDGDIDEDLVPIAAVGLIGLEYPRAKRDLIEAGYSLEQVDEMPVGQLVAIHQLTTYEHVYHEFFKWVLLPFHQAWQRQQQSEQQLRERGYFDLFEGEGEIIPMTSVFLPALTRAWQVEARLNAHTAALQTVEAIRMHAAENGHQLPSTLEEIQVVPVPRNTIDNQPLPYQLEGETAVLRIPESPALRAEDAWRLRIALSVQ